MTKPRLSAARYVWNEAWRKVRIDHMGYMELENYHPDNVYYKAIVCHILKGLAEMNEAIPTDAQQRLAPKHAYMKLRLYQ